MQPDDKLTRANFTVNGLAFGIAVNAAGSEAKRFNEEVMGSRNVLIYEDWNDAFDLWHVWLLQPWFVLV